MIGKNLGSSEGHDVGIMEADGDYIAFHFGNFFFAMVLVAVNMLFSSFYLKPTLPPSEHLRGKVSPLSDEDGSMKV